MLRLGSRHHCSWSRLQQVLVTPVNTTPSTDTYHHHPPPHTTILTLLEKSVFCVSTILDSLQEWMIMRGSVLHWWTRCELWTSSLSSPLFIRLSPWWWRWSVSPLSSRESRSTPFWHNISYYSPQPCKLKSEIIITSHPPFSSNDFVILIKTEFGGCNRKKQKKFH